MSPFGRGDECLRPGRIPQLHNRRRLRHSIDLPSTEGVMHERDHHPLLDSAHAAVIGAFRLSQAGDDRADYGTHDCHVDHSVARFRDRFWIALLATAPACVYDG